MKFSPKIEDLQNHTGFDGFLPFFQSQKGSPEPECSVSQLSQAPQKQTSIEFIESRKKG